MSDDLDATPVPPGPAEDVPEAAGRRLAGRAWSSGLSIPDLATGLTIGAQPVGVVQGYAVMQWTSSYTSGTWAWGPRAATGDAYYEQWQCPHGFVSAEHRSMGSNWEQVWLEASWARGWELSRQRMLEEAETLGAHGVIGVTDDSHPLVGGGTMEFRMSGTAVVVEGAPRPDPPFATYLAGQRLAKLLDSGYVPVMVVGALASVQMFGYCMTQYQMRGSVGGSWSGMTSGSLMGVHAIAQADRANAAARHLARSHVRRQLGGDFLHGTSVWQSERELGEGDLVVQCLLRGTRARRVAPAGEVPEVAPTVRLG